MPNAVDSLIKDRISSFVQELDQLVRKSTLEALSSILTNGTAPVRRGRPAGSGRGPGRPKGSGRGGNRGGNVEEAAAKIVAHVQANDGQGIGAIASAAAIPLPLAKKAAIQMLASGALKKSGQKRGTIYHVGSGKPAKAKRAKRSKGRGRKRKAA